jgi:flagellar basal body-associated protein FliL
VLISAGMSEAAAAEKPATAPKAGGNKILLMVVLLVNVLIAGGLAYVVIAGQQKAAAPAKAAGDGTEAAGEEEEAEEAHTTGEFGPLIEVGSFVANLTALPGQPSRYAKVTVHVEASSEDTKEKVEAAVVPIRNEALLYLSGLLPEQVIGQEKIRMLQDELLKRVNKLVGKKMVKRVYFSEFVVQ